MDDPVDVNKTIGFDYLDDDDGSPNHYRQGTAAKPSRRFGNETVLQTGELSSFSCQQALRHQIQNAIGSRLVVLRLQRLVESFTLINKLI